MEIEQSGEKRPTPPVEAESNEQTEGRKSVFPLARVKRIMKVDKQVGSCSNEAVIAMSAAAVHFSIASNNFERSCS